MNVTSLHKEINSPYFQAKLIFSYFYLLFCKPGELFFIPTLRNSSHQQHTFKYFLCSFFSAAENLIPFDPAYTTEFCLKMQISFSFLFRDPTYAILAAQPNSRFSILILIWVFRSHFLIVSWRSYNTWIYNTKLIHEKYKWSAIKSLYELKVVQSFSIQWV